MVFVAVAPIACNAILGLEELPFAPTAADGVPSDGGTTDGVAAIDGSGPARGLDAESPVSNPAGEARGTLRRVFLSEPKKPVLDFSSRATADAICSLALKKPGVVAWLSDGSGAAIDRLVSDVTWVNIYDETVFKGKDAIASGTGPEHQIYPLRESGTDPSTPVWTGTDWNGRNLNPSLLSFGTCLSWGNTATTGVYGNPHVLAPNKGIVWTNAGTEVCVASLRLYCFEL
jgi:hypothetical protein